MNERFKLRIKDYNSEKLKELLKELMLEVMKVETELHTGLKNRQAYPPPSGKGGSSWRGGNLRALKKHIAIIKTKLGGRA